MQDKPLLIHVFARDGVGGCERNAESFIRAAPKYQHKILIAGPGTGVLGSMVGAAVITEYASSKNRGFIATGLLLRKALGKIVVKDCPVAVLAWHGMVYLPFMLSAVQGVRVQLLLHAGNPATKLKRWVAFSYQVLELLMPSTVRPRWFCASQYVADSVSQHSYLGRFPAAVVYNGVMPPGFEHNPIPIDRGEKLVIGMVSRLDRIKDHAFLLEAFALVKKQWPQAHLELIGSGAEQERLINLAERLGIEQSVDFLGEKRDVYKYMARWNVFCFCTTAHEGLGNALIEALMLGLPCVTVRIGPTPEIVQQPAYGVLVEQGDAQSFAEQVVALADDYDRRCKMSAAARQYARDRFSPESAVASLEKLIVQG